MKKHGRRSRMISGCGIYLFPLYYALFASRSMSTYIILLFGDSTLVGSLSLRHGTVVVYFALLRFEGVPDRARFEHGRGS